MTVVFQIWTCIGKLWFRCPDITFTVDWAIRISYLCICHDIHSYRDWLLTVVKFIIIIIINILLVLLVLICYFWISSSPLKIMIVIILLLLLALLYLSPFLLYQNSNHLKIMMTTQAGQEWRLNNNNNNTNNNDNTTTTTTNNNDGEYINRQLDRTQPRKWESRGDAMTTRDHAPKPQDRTVHEAPRLV